MWIMVNITLSIPNEIREKMKKYKEIKWSEIVREAIIEKLKKLEEVEMREYALKRLSNGEDAHELFEY